MNLFINGNGQGKEKMGWRGGNHRRWEKTVLCDSCRVHEGKLYERRSGTTAREGPDHKGSQMICWI